MSRRRQGWTLFELVLVLALLVIVAAVGLPSLENSYASFRLRSAADAIRAAWATARSDAMNRGCAYRFGIMPGTGKYRIAPDDANAASSMPSDNLGPVTSESSLPAGVSLGTSGNTPTSASGSLDDAGWVPVAVFLPNGTAREDVRLVLTTKGAKPLLLKLRGLTGGVTTEWLQNEGSRQ